MEQASNKSLAGKEHMLRAFRQWEKVLNANRPRREHFSPVSWIRSSMFLLFCRHDYTYEMFDEYFFKYFPEIEKGSREYKKMFRDAIDCCYCYGAASEDYFESRFFEKNHAGRNAAVTHGRRYRLYTMFNGKVVLDEIDSKCDCCKTLKQFYHRDAVPLSSETDRAAFEAFFDKHEKGLVKPSREFGGHGIRLISREQVRNDPDFFDGILRQDGEALLEELVIQDPRMAYFNESSVNTIRVEIIRRGGKSEPLFCLCRFGAPGSLTDNVCSGGNGLIVDIKSGITYSNSLNGTTDPVTGKLIVGIHIPEWESLMKIACEAADVLPQYRLIAFDFALSENHGWVLIEANSHGGFNTVNKNDMFSYQEMERLFLEG